MPKCCEVRVGTIADLSAEEIFDTVLYIDVLEHLKDDRADLELATTHLKTRGFLIILAPAHQELFTSFDRAIGHYRRYNRRSLSSIVPSVLRRHELHYADSIGAIASVANRFILKSAMPTANQIALWDKALIPISRIIDPLILYSLGKSIIGVWQK